MPVILLPRWTAQASGSTNLWQMALRAGVEVALSLVELRGFEPLTPCMPLMCGWFTSPCTTSPTHATEQVKRRCRGLGRGATPGYAKRSFWQIPGKDPSHGRLPFPLGTPQGTGCTFRRTAPASTRPALTDTVRRRSLALVRPESPCYGRITSRWDRFPFGGTQGRSAGCSVRGSWQGGCC